MVKLVMRVVSREERVGAAFLALHSDQGDTVYVTLPYPVVHDFREGATVEVALSVMERTTP